MESESLQAQSLYLRQFVNFGHGCISPLKYIWF